MRKALEHPGSDFETFIISNADTVMTRPNSDLMAEVFPSVPLQRDVGPVETLLSIEKAQRVLGHSSLSLSDGSACSPSARDLDRPFPSAY